MAGNEEDIEGLRKQIAHVEAQLSILRARLTRAENGHVPEGEPPTNLNACKVETLDHTKVTSREEFSGTDRVNKSHRWPLSEEEYRRYGRQMITPQIGLEGRSLSIWHRSASNRRIGQLRLQKASVLIVGLGGLGCPAAAYLAGAGVGTLGLIDGDAVEVSNLHRQILHSSSRVGMSKVDSACKYLKEYVDHHQLETAAADLQT